MISRSDLALEAADSLLTGEKLPDGVSLKSYVRGAFNITDVKIYGDCAAKKLGKSKGRYLTLETRESFDTHPGDFAKDSLALADELRSMIGNPERVLVVGLGNFDVTPDSLGTRVADRIIATRHIMDNYPELDKMFQANVSVLKTGVMGKTGMESAEAVKATAKAVKPDCIIVCDALACSGVSRLGCAIQLTDTGISPGSGVMNSRKEISKRTVGVPCVAIGVPTMADSKELEMMVTPKNIDKLIHRSSRLIANAINLCLHPELTISEIEVLTE